MTNNHTTVMITKDQIDEYKQLGYNQGRKINVKN
jgi:hypothetical protein